MKDSTTNIDVIRERARGHWPSIFDALGIEVGTGKHRPCPACGGRDRFRFDNQDGNGTWFCNQCSPQAGDGFRLVQNARGCDFPHALQLVADTLGLQSSNEETSRKIVATYNYTDANGGLLFQVLRYAPKSFRQRRPDGYGGWIWDLQDVRPVAYHLPILTGQPRVYIVEGEKDVERLRSFGLSATCNSGGAGKWTDEHTQQLIAAGVQEVIIPPDNDDPGRKHAQAVARSCVAAGLAAKIITLPDLPPKGDVSNFLDAGGTIGEMQAIVEAATPWMPEAQSYHSDPLPELHSGAFAPVIAPQLLDEPVSVQPAWVWEEFIPEGALAALIAKPKVGKTTNAYELTVKVAQGLPYLGRATRRGPVLILALEEHRREVKRRLRNLGADQIEEIHLHIGPLADSPDTFYKLNQYIGQHGIIFVILDTLNTFWSVQEENDAVEVTKAIKPLLGLARESGAAILLLHHARKSEGEFGDEIRGSGALFSLLDIALILKRHEVENQRKLTAISRYPETPPELIIELREHGHEALGDPASVGKAAKTTKVRAALTDSPTPAAEIGRRAGVSRGATYTILDQLVLKGQAQRAGAGKRNDPHVYWNCVSVSPLRGGGTNDTNSSPQPNDHEASPPEGFVSFGVSTLVPQENETHSGEDCLVSFREDGGQTRRNEAKEGDGSPEGLFAEEVVNDDY